jgi:hypothetical protein
MWRKQRPATSPGSSSATSEVRRNTLQSKIAMLRRALDAST